MNMSKKEQQPADEILAHSTDDGEWDDEAETIEARPSGTQVISARIPTPLAEQFFAEAARRRMKVSDLVREALDLLLSPRGVGRASVNATASILVRVDASTKGYRTANPNLVVDIETEPPRHDALGFVEGELRSAAA